MACCTQQPCPCGSARIFADCCGIFIFTAASATTAEQLMRSRYSAYVCEEAEYLRQTWHPQTRPGIGVEVLSSSAQLIWCGLQIVARHQGLAHDSCGEVEFVARYVSEGESGQLHELSQFVKQQGRWFYLHGEINPTQAAAAKIARNAPCSCGSGRKFKRCCGK